jgi:hypothetical protein
MRLKGFVRPTGWNSSSITEAAPEETRLEALIKLEVACRLALESLPHLPRETEDVLREPIETLCGVTERELERIKPGQLNREGDSS